MATLSIQDVELQLAKDGDKFRAVTAAVRTACEQVEAELGVGVVRSIYGRADKQHKLNLSHKDLKSPEKIALALRRKNSTALADIDDISGLTVVVHYSDQIDEVLRRVIERLKKHRIQPKHPPKIRKSGGYYATHVVFESDHTDHRKFCCELQAKTMLHDAWAAKTHDLTYKPQGRNDVRFNRMMDVFADALQAIEVQSETLRDVIEERWASERGWRNLLRRSLFEFLPTWLDTGIHSAGGQQLRREITDERQHIATADGDDPVFQEIARRVDDLCQKSPREGYLLEAYIAVLRDLPKDRSRAIEQTTRWLGLADEEYRKGRAKPHEVWSAPLILYACGDLDGAIKAAEDLSQSSSLAGRERQALLFNLANHLVEKAYFSPPLTETDRTDLERKIRGLIDASELLREEDPTPFHDAEGMFTVAFSQDPIEIRNAIDLIQKGRENVPYDQEAADAYYELHIRLAWRRLLEIETQIARSKRAALS